ncbi:MAG: carboxypeptidase-like regulatory domain-containing protein [Leeuwenhoekiella sp.]
MNFSIFRLKISECCKIIPVLAVLLAFSTTTRAQGDLPVIYSGVVLDNGSGDELAGATLSVLGTNISTITNSEGYFQLRLAEDMPKAKIEISLLGYENLIVILSNFTKSNNIIKLRPVNQLDEISISAIDVQELMRKVFANRRENYMDDNTLMTAFYRESIKRRNTNVSLAEAVVFIDKRPYYSLQNDRVSLYKARKSTDYSRLDTIALKLQGGPLNALFIDVIKYPDYFMDETSLAYYDFELEAPTVLNGDTTHVVSFKHKTNIIDPLYYGRIYIHQATNALTNAVFSLDVSNRQMASELFVKKKPKKVKVYPTTINYKVDYKSKDGKWFLSKSAAQLDFVVNWRRKIFNTKYQVNCEMFVNDWKKVADISDFDQAQRFKSGAILADEASGFSDPNFWGAYNVIEPDESIERAIEKIKAKLNELTQ